ncbi:MAG: metallophosphoesterase [Magnetococcus sp. YQC-3]
MPAQTTMTSLPPTVHPSQEEWDSGRLWDRIRSGFQGALRHIWSEETAGDPQPAWLLPEPVSPQPDPSPTQPETQAEPQAEIQAEVQAEIQAEVQAEIQTEAPLPTGAASQSPPTRATWRLVLSDTDNDFRTVLRILWFVGLCDQNGCWMPGLPNIQVIHTGDWLNKWAPNPYVLDGFKRLQETTPDQCQLILLNGNHELSVLQMADQGLRTPLTADDLAFIRRQHLLHIEQETLFLHGYPSTDLLLILKQFQREGTEREAFNTRLQRLFFDGSYPLFREARSLRIIGDIKTPRLYYNQKNQNGLLRGNQMAALLRELEVATVIHGHKPGSAIQQDRELQEEVPGIRLINNDNRIQQTGWGGLLLSDQGDTVFINPHTLRAAGSEKNLRKRLRKLLETRKKDLHARQPQAVRRGVLERIAA